MRAFAWNVGTCRLDDKGEIQAWTRKDESTEARHRDGLPCSSEEGWQYSWSEGGKWS